MMALSSRGTWLAIAGGAAFVGWCIYYDHKRRSAPDFREKLIARRRAEREKSRRGGKSSGFGASAIPDLRDTASRQKFFIQEVQLGEALLSQGELEEGVLHIANAAAVCAEGEQFIQVLASSLPREILQMVISALPDARRRIQASQSSSSGGGDKRTATIREVDEEVDVE